MNKATCLISPRLPEPVRAELRRLGCIPIEIPECRRLSAPVRSHPDMLFHRLPDGTLLTERRYYYENIDFFERNRLAPLLTERELEADYPHDIALDCLSAEGILFGRLDAAAPELLAAYERRVRVRQGYARCSCAAIGRGFVTSDRGLYSALTSHGIPALSIAPGDVELPGYDYGFIGGASFALSRRLTLFFGRLPEKEAERIREFAARLEVELIESECTLIDCGGAVAIEL